LEYNNYKKSVYKQVSVHFYKDTSRNRINNFQNILKMKKSRLVLTLMILALAILVSCEKDKEENNNPKLLLNPQI